MNSLPLLLSNNIAPSQSRYSETHSTNSATIISDRSITERQTSPDLRLTVARRFMRMLRAHDRTRQEMLAAYSSQPR